jgi:TetR/AcrR family transcriptional regulator of autoinduction and epiphytic fitness
VSKRTVYNHFPSKEELFAEILNQLWTRVTGRARNALSR